MDDLPLASKHAELVHRIFTADLVIFNMRLDSFICGPNNSFVRFLKAVNLTRQQDVPLHVDLLPPRDPEQTENFAHHCRFCKVASPKDWYVLSGDDSHSSGASNPQKPLTITCPNCEMPYDPSMSPYPIRQLQTDARRNLWKGCWGTRIIGTSCIARS